MELNRKFPPELRKLASLARSQGWNLESTKNGHFKWFSPAGIRVVTSCGKGDPYAVAHIRKDLLRAGLVLNPKDDKMTANGATTSLGDVLKSAHGSIPKPTPDIVTVATTRDLVPTEALYPPTLSAGVLQFFKERDHDRHWRSEDVCTHIKGKGYGVTDAAVYQSIKVLWLRGDLHKAGRGLYQLKGHGYDTHKPASTSIVQAVVTPQGTQVAGARSGDPSIDADLEELDEALAALANIELIVKKYRGIIGEAVKLKRALAGIDLGAE